MKSPVLKTLCKTVDTTSEKAGESTNWNPQQNTERTGRTYQGLFAGPGRERVSKNTMNSDDRELMKHEVPDEAAIGHTDPPPFVEAPDMAETLRLLEKVSRMPDIRFEQVQRMRELIAENKLETPERVNGTVRRLMEELGL